MHMTDLVPFQPQVEIRTTLSLDSTQLPYATNDTRKHLKQIKGHFIPSYQMSLYFLYTLVFSRSVLCSFFRFVLIYSQATPIPPMHGIIQTGIQDDL